MGRYVLIGGFAVMFLIGIAVFFALSRLDSIVHAAIERYGSEITGVPVRVGSVGIQLGRGRVTIAGLQVPNPDGYSENDAFSLGEITVEIDPATLTATPIVVRELTVAAPAARYEMNARGRTNFDAIRDNVKRYSASAPAPDEAEAVEEEEPGAGLRLAVQQFRLRDGEVTADVSALAPGAKLQKVPLPAIALDDIGGAEGATPGELGKVVLDSFTKAVLRAARDVAKQQTRKLLEGVGGKAGKGGKQAVELLDKLF